MLSQVATAAAAVHAEACRELVVHAGEGAEAQCWRLLAAESGGYLGIGGKLWDSSWNLAAFLAEDAANARRRGGAGLLSGRRVLELGAGTGVLGGLCAQLGAASVTVVSGKAITDAW